MKTLFRMALLVLVGFAGIGLWARWISRRRQAPCPWWLNWLLENPYMEAVASSKELVERARLAPGMKVLDAGCGPGRLTIAAAQQVGPRGEVVGLDIQAEQLQRAQSRAEAANVTNVRFVHASLGEGKLPEAGFDRALLCAVLGEITDREAALAEVFKALKPGGILSVTEVLPDPHYQGQPTLRTLASKAGFVEDQVSGSRLAYTMNLVKPEQPPPWR